MSTRARSFVSGLVLVSCLLACKPTVDGELREWTSNVEATREFESRWPGFTPVLQSTRAEAETLMQAADGITSDDARAEVMDAANKVLGPLVGRLRSAAAKLDELDAAARRLDRLRIEEQDQRKVQDAKDAAAQIHAEVGKALADAAPANQAAALRVLDEQITRLDGAIARCEELFEQLSQPNDAKPELKPKPG